MQHPLIRLRGMTQLPITSRLYLQLFTTSSNPLRRPRNVRKSTLCSWTITRHIEQLTPLHSTYEPRISLHTLRIVPLRPPRTERHRLRTERQSCTTRCIVGVAMHGRYDGVVYPCDCALVVVFRGGRVVDYVGEEGPADVWLGGTDVCGAIVRLAAGCLRSQ